MKFDKSLRDAGAVLSGFVLMAVIGQHPTSGSVFDASSGVRFSKVKTELANRRPDHRNGNQPMDLRIGLAWEYFIDESGLVSGGGRRIVVIHAADDEQINRLGIGLGRSGNLFCLECTDGIPGKRLPWKQRLIAIGAGRHTAEARLLRTRLSDAIRLSGYHDTIARRIYVIGDGLANIGQILREDDGPLPVLIDGQGNIWTDSGDRYRFWLHGGTKSNFYPWPVGGLKLLLHNADLPLRFYPQAMSSRGVPDEDNKTHEFCSESDPISAVPGNLYLCFGFALYGYCYGFIKFHGNRTGQVRLFLLLFCGFLSGLAICAHGISLLTDRQSQLIDRESQSVHSAYKCSE
jgi:hypothetical protein